MLELVRRAMVSVRSKRDEERRMIDAFLPERLRRRPTEPLNKRTGRNPTE